MPLFIFDAKVFATVHVTAADEITARELLDNYATDLMEGSAWDNDEHEQRVFINSASQDGDADLMEVDGAAQ